MPETEPFFLEALAYCDEHDVATYGNCVRGHYAMALVDHGRWDEALRQANQVLDTKASPINRLSSLVTVGIVLARRGDPAAAEFLVEADGRGGRRRRAASTSPGPAADRRGGLARAATTTRLARSWPCCTAG